MSGEKLPIMIIGQGLAGSALALALRERGVGVKVLNDPACVGASKVAAGLITTLAGKSMNPAWRQEQYLPEALKMYRELEERSGESFLQMMPIVRPFESAKQQEKFLKKKEKVLDWVAEQVEAPQQLNAQDGHFTMASSGRLDTVKYLAVVRGLLGEDYFDEALDEEDLVMVAHGVKWKGQAFQKVIYCNGVESFSSNYWSMIPHRSAKGEMLTIQLDGVSEKQIMSRNGWLVPLGDQKWKAGATYTRDVLDSGCTDAGRNEVEKKVKSLIGENYQVIGHCAGVRPIVNNSKPIVGMHQEFPQIGIFNGLGSRGVMTAPSVARHFVEVMLDGVALDPELDYQRTQ